MKSKEFVLKRTLVTGTEGTTRAVKGDRVYLSINKNAHTVGHGSFLVAIVDRGGKAMVNAYDARFWVSVNSLQNYIEQTQ